MPDSQNDYLQQLLITAQASQNPASGSAARQSAVSGNAAGGDVVSGNAAGEFAAIEELFSYYQHYLRLLAYSGLSQRVQSRVTVSDIVQETMLKAFEAFEQFRGSTMGEFVTWLRTILVSRIADAHEKHLKAARRDVRREVAIETIEENLSRSSHGLDAIARDHLQKSPGAIVAQQEQTLAVADAIGKLPADYRQVVMMRHFDGKPFEEIATQMNRTSGAIRMIWLRAIQQMKSNLREPSS